MLRVTVVALVAACACTRSPRAGDDATAEMTKPPPPTPAAVEPRATVRLAGPSGEATVAVEVVQSAAQVERGLMYRQHLPPDAGMLFLMGEEREQTFWMRNTLIPLDMIFIGRDLVVVGVVEKAQPRTDTIRTVGKPSLYVLEVNGGWASAHGVGAGTKVSFQGVEAAAR